MEQHSESALFGIHLSGVCASKPIGHAALILGLPENSDLRFTQYDYDAASLLVSRDYDIPRPRGAMIWRSIPAQDGRRLSAYFDALSDRAVLDQQSIYFSMNLEPNEKYESRGRKPANCLTSLFHVLTQENVPPCMVGELVLGSDHRPVNVMHALNDIAAVGKRDPATDAHAEFAGENNWVGMVSGADGRRITVVTGLDGGLHVPELMQTDVMIGCSNHHLGSLASVIQCGSEVLPFTAWTAERFTAA